MGCASKGKRMSGFKTRQIIKECANRKQLMKLLLVFEVFDVLFTNCALRRLSSFLFSEHA